MTFGLAITLYTSKGLVIIYLVKNRRWGGLIEKEGDGVKSVFRST